MTVTIYHDPNSGTSRNTLAMIQQSGIELEVIEYLKVPPTRERLVEFLAAIKLSARELLRRKGTPYDELRLDAPSLAEGQLIDINPTNLSFHHNQLRHAGLIESRRKGRSLIYTARTEVIDELTDYLRENCCTASVLGGSNCPPRAKKAGARAVERKRRSA